MLSETPLVAPASGLAHYRARVPGSLSGVLFARVVPLTEGHVEARFVDCGLVCLAVPHDQSPPAPTLRVSPRADGRFDITVEGIGFRRALLDRFSQNFSVSRRKRRVPRPPEFRLRRTQGANTESVYAREILQDKMIIEPGGDGRAGHGPNLTGQLRDFRRLSDLLGSPKCDIRRRSAGLSAE